MAFFWQRLFGLTSRRRVTYRKLGGERLESRSLLSGLHGADAPWKEYDAPGVSVTRTFDVQQRLIHEEANVDGTIQITDWTYDRQGWLTLTRQTVDWYSNSDSGADGVADSIWSHTYERDTAGRVVADTFFDDYNTHDEGFSLSRTTVEYRSQRANDLSLNWERLTYDSDGDGVLDQELSATHYAYDRRGNLISSVYREDMDADGTMDVLVTADSTYDRRGLLLYSQNTSQYIGIGADLYGTGATTTLARRYDATGRLIEVDQASDQGSNGSVEFRSTATFDAAGRLLSRVERSDFNGDGATDEERFEHYVFNRAGQLTHAEVRGFYLELPEFGAFYLNRGALPVIDGSADYTYDARGNPISLAIHNDTDSDGVVDLVFVSTWSEDRRGNVTGVLTEDSGNDGVIDYQFDFQRRMQADGRSFVDSSEITEYLGGELVVRQGTREVSYDRQGRLLRDYSNFDDGLETFLVTIQYDARGRVVSAEQSFKDERYHFAQRADYTYDRRGRVVGEIQSYDHDGDGEFDDILFATATFDREGRLIEIARARDYNGDGTIDWGYSERWAY